MCLKINPHIRFLTIFWFGRQLLEFCLADTLSIVRFFLTLFYLPFLFQKRILIIMSDLDYDYGDGDYDDGGSDSGHRRDGSQSGSGLESGEESDGEVFDDVRKQFEEGRIVVPRLQLCSVHKPGHMVEVCQTCNKALSMLMPEVAKEMMTPMPATALARYAARSDEKAPTLILPNGIVELAENTFHAGMFRGRSHFNELVQKYLCLPPDQHRRLTKDLQQETMFRKMESEKRFKFIFQFKKEMGDCLKNLRVSQRLVFCMIDTIDKHIPVLRGLAMSAGIGYPAMAPNRNNPRVPKVLQDTLAVGDVTKVLPLPVLTNIFAGVSTDISELDRAKIAANMTVMEDEMASYRANAVQHYMSLYEAAAGVSNTLDDFLNFYTDVYGHNDACLRDLIRSKLANLFRSEFRSEILGKHLSVEERKQAKDTGLLGGMFVYIFYITFSYSSFPR